MAKVLLSTPCQPYPTHFDNSSLTDAMSQRFTKGQDIFTNISHMHCYGSHLIAQNISVPSVFLEYPHWEDFEAEVRKGYDFVGISFFPTCMNIVLDMCRAVRKLSPSSRIVLGHYGAMAFDAAFPEDFKQEHADHVCIGEGVRFFRQLLGEPLDAPIRQTHLPRCSNNLPWLDRHPRGLMGWVVAGLGCPSGCDFCSTTQMHANQRVRLYGPEETFRELKRIWRQYPDTQQVFIYDEDYLKWADEVRELAKLIQEDTELGLRKINFVALSSIESLNQYEMDELALTGFAGTFIGFESKFAPDRGYQKRTGRDAKETVDELHKRGIACTGGFMCGFEWHDRITLEEDFNFYLSLGLVTKQISQVTAFPGTPFWERLKEEERLIDLPWEDVNFYGGNFRHKNFERHELQQFIYNGYQRYYETHGPTLMRQLRVSLNGYEHARSKGPHPLWDQLVERHREVCQMIYPTARACEHFAPNGIVRRQILQTEERYRRNFAPPSPSQQVMSAYILAKAFQARAQEALFPRRPKQEPFKKYVYDRQSNGADNPPYRVVYPREDRAYERYRDFRTLKEELLGKALKWLDQVESPTQGASLSAGAMRARVL